MQFAVNVPPAATVEGAVMVAEGGLHVVMVAWPDDVPPQPFPSVMPTTLYVVVVDGQTSRKTLEDVMFGCVTPSDHVIV